MAERLNQDPFYDICKKADDEERASINLGRIHFLEQVDTLKKPGEVYMGTIWVSENKPIKNYRQHLMSIHPDTKFRLVNRAFDENTGEELTTDAFPRDKDEPIEYPFSVFVSKRS
ncbi:MAG: hypothetical protein ABSC49_04335 [Candidatus Microgenomates bacterium]|jgi:hypothetical protein